MNLPGYSPDFNADEAVWGWAREEVTGNLCLGSRAAVQERVGKFLAGLSSRKDEVRRRCRTVLQSRAETLPRDSPPRFPAPGKCTSHLGFGLAGQADHYGVAIGIERTNYGTEYEDAYPDHWPATRQRLENTAEWSKQFNDMVDENHWNQKLMGFSAQQEVENALRGLLSVHNDPTTFRHGLGPVHTSAVHRG